MKVKFLSGPKQGTIEHLPPHICQPLIAAGICEHIPFKDFRERLAAEQAQMSAAPAPTVEWGIKEKGLSEWSQIAVIKRVGNETTFFKTPPPDCPKSIVERFKQLTDGTPQEYSPDEAAMFATAAYVGDSNKHRPVLQGHDATGKPLYRDPTDFRKP